MEPVLSIIIPAYNVQDYICSAVKSALAQTVAEIEVIVIDDGSTDETAAIVQGLCDDRLRLIRQPNAGLAAARNTGIRAARGEYVGLLDGDDLWLPEMAERHLEVMRADPQIGITYNDSLYINEQGKPRHGVLFSPIRNPTVDDMVRRNLAGNGSTLIARRNCLLQAGLFNENLRSCEDYEMWIRVLHNTPYKMCHIAQPLTKYRIRSSSLTMNFDSFLKNAEAVLSLLEAYPRISQGALRRGRSEMYRMVSRKALDSGEDALAWRYLSKALRVDPANAVTNVRATITVALILSRSVLPKRWHDVPVRMVSRVARICHSLVTGRP